MCCLSLFPKQCANPMEFLRWKRESRRASTRGAKKRRWQLVVTCAVPSTSGPFACDSGRDLLLLVDCLGIAAGRITGLYRVSSVYSVFTDRGLGVLER